MFLFISTLILFFNWFLKSVLNLLQCFFWFFYVFFFFGPCLKRETTSGTWIHVDLAAFHRAPKPALPSHPPPWAPEIGMVTSSSFLLPPPRNSGTMVGLGPIRTQASALDMRALPPPPHTEDFSLSLQLGHHLSRAGCTGNREGSLSKSKKCSLDHLFDPCSASVTLPWPRLARNQR